MKCGFETPPKPGCIQIQITDCLTYTNGHWAHPLL
nr:MAG TPA: hypothetical protein [Bacteriophage sp.]